MTSVKLPDPIDPDAFKKLELIAAVVDDFEELREATVNRLSALTRSGPDADGEERGLGLDESDKDVALLIEFKAKMLELENVAIRRLQLKMRAHPLHPWLEAQRGVGEKQGARLLAAIGNPYWNTVTNKPRTVGQLWSYCGLAPVPVDHDGVRLPYTAIGEPGFAHPGNPCADPDCKAAWVTKRMRRGQKVDWSPTAKMRAYLIAVQVMKMRHPYYREVYDKRRARTELTHPDWTALHSHNDALHVTAKEILKDMWRESKRLHEQNETHDHPD
jgi:hypothetical protein